MKKYILLSIPFLLFWVLTVLFPSKSCLFYVLSAFINLCLGCYCYRKDNLKSTLYLIFLQGIALKFLYITYTPFNIRQHDVGAFTEEGRGHFQYIYYILKYHTLPFFHQPIYLPIAHPPLYYIISAGFLWICRQLSIFSYEPLQYLPLLFTTGIAVVSFLCIKPFVKSKVGLVVAACFCQFFPFFTVLSGALNNDPLGILLSVLFIYFFIQYLQTRKNIFFAVSSLMLGLSCLTKLNSIVLYAAVVLFYFLLWIRHKIKWADMVKQNLLFCAVSLPLALSWSLYNFFRWGADLSPVNYHQVGIIRSVQDTFTIWFNHYNPFLHADVTDLELILRQDISQYSVFDRLLPVFEPIRHVFLLVGKPFMEYNVWTAVIKTALFEELGLGRFSDFGLLAAWIITATLMLILGYFLAGIFATSLLHEVKRHSEVALFSKVVIAVTFVFFIHWCLGNPVWSACSFRYIAGIFPCFCLSALFFIQDLSKHRFHQIIRPMIIASLLALCILSQVFYVVLGLVEYSVL